MSYKLREGVFVAETEDGIALLDEDSGEYWNLNPTGALVLRRLLDGGTPEQAAEQVTKEYVVDIDTANRDAHELVEGLRAAKLIEAPATADLSKKKRA